MAGRRRQADPWPGVPWPDIALPAWLGAVVESWKIWGPILVAIMVALEEVDRRRKKQAEQQRTREQRNDAQS